MEFASVRDASLAQIVKNRKRQLVLAVIVAHAAASSGHAVFFPLLGPTAGIFGLVAVVVGAMCFGLRGGLASAVAQTLLNTIVMGWIVYPPQEFHGKDFLGIVFLFAVGAALGNQRDLSRRLRKELELNEQLRLRERETLAAIPDAMLRVGLDGTCRLQGVDRSGSLAQVLEFVLGRSLSAERQSAINESVERVRAVGAAQVLTLDFSGTSSYEIRFLPAADESVLVVVRDVTEQRKLLRRVTSAENLASLGTLAAGLAHEINNPLTYVITSVSAIGQSLTEGDQEATTELDAALDGCWRIRDLVQNILETTNSRKQDAEPVSVPEVIDAALKLVMPQVRHRATILWERENVPPALAHRTKLLQVVVNLLVNAGQAFLDSRVSANQILVRAYGEGEQVVIQVQDNGPGMDEATRLRALEPFFTTKNPGQGAGLGLFLCSSILESLGGTLLIESDLGQGTKISVRLPVADDAPMSRVVVRRKQAIETESHSRVLVVDDEPQIRRALQRLLGKNRTVSFSANGAEALQRLVDGERFDVILCDILMPEMTGLELFGELIRRFPDQAERVVFLTGGATSDTARVFLNQFGARVVNKPFKPPELEEAILTLVRSPLPLITPSIMP